MNSRKYVLKSLWKNNSEVIFNISKTVFSKINFNGVAEKFVGGAGRNNFH